MQKDEVGDIISSAYIAANIIFRRGRVKLLDLVITMERPFANRYRFILLALSAITLVPIHGIAMLKHK